MTTISPADHDWPILTDYLAGVDLLTLCENHNLSPVDLEQFLDSPRVAPALAALQRLHARRATLAASQAALPAITALSITASTVPPPLDPAADPAALRLHARQSETIRKSASTLLKVAAITPPLPAQALRSGEDAEHRGQGEGLAPDQSSSPRNPPAQTDATLDALMPLNHTRPAPAHSSPSRADSPHVESALHRLSHAA